MRLWWITATALLVLLSFTCFFGTSESTENGYVEAKDFRSGASSSSENKVTIRRRLIRRKLDSASGETEKENATVSMRVSTSQKGPEASSEDTSLPKSTTFTQARRALFNRLNKPLLKNRSLDSTISKLRSRLGAVSSEGTSTPKPRYYKKVIKKATTSKPDNEKSEETSPISIQVPTDKPSYKRNDSMIMIPVPESQRKPYQPVIMQVTKSNESASTAAPSTNVVTYKLNKMFVPMGIYGRVVHDSENATSTSQEAGVKGPEVRHKGTQSESSEKTSGVKVSDGSDEKWEHLMKEIKSKGKKTRKQKEHSSIADTIDITYNYMNKPKYDQVSITTERTDASKISLTTEKPMFQASPSAEKGNQNRRTSSWGPGSNSNQKSGSKMTMMSPPGPMRKESSSSSTGPMGFLDTLKQTASNIPGFFHKGFTSLTSISNAYAENPFHDDTFASGSEIRPGAAKNPGIIGSVPGGYIQTKKPTPMSPGASSLSEYESLEYFRNRPHLFGRQNKFKESKSISGFKPVTAPAHMAKEYFGSTQTTPSPRTTDSYSSASQETVLKASPSTWKAVDTRSKGVPTEELNSSWKDYLFQPNEYGTEPGPSRTWRSMFGLGPAVEESSMMSPTFGNRFHMLDGGRRRSMQLDRQWKDITRKYTKSEIDEAKERIYEVYSGAQERSDDEINIMRPPSPRIGGAFDDLMKMFKLWFNVGHGKSVHPVKNFDHIKSSEGSRSSEDSWKPVSKPGGKPLISFSAGISFPTKNPSHHGGPGGTHYSASPKPFIPHGHKLKGLSNHITTLATHYGGPTKSTPYSDFGKDSQYTSHSIESDPSSYYGSPTPTEDELEQHGGEDHYSIADSESSLVSQYAKGSLKEFTLNSEPLKESASSQYASSVSGSQYSTSSDADADESPYELVPSDVYFSQKNPNFGEIAAVVKPEGITDDELKAHLPTNVAGVPTLNYPSQLKNPQQSFSSLNHLQQYLTTSDGKAPSAAYLAHKERAEKYKVKEQSFMLPQKYYDAQYAQNSYLSSNNFVYQNQPSSIQSVQAKLNPQTYQQLQFQQSLYKPQQVQQQQQHFIQYSDGQVSGGQGLNGQIIQQQTRLKTTGDSGLGFSDFELPPNMDPDIAALLKAELDKDDVPEEIRKEFQEAKKEEAAKQANAIRQQSQQQQQQTSQSNRRSDFIAQQSHQHQYQQPSGYTQQAMRQFAKPFNFLQNQKQNTHPFQNHQQNQNHQRQMQQSRPSSSSSSASSYHQFHFNRPNPNPIPFVPSNRRQSQVVSKFFAPIPISPQTQTQTLRGRYQSPVPRYVVELAKKLQRDKDVQGIVRVSTKRGSGPPIEYLYPVRG